MEAVYSLKRSRQPGNAEACVICQEEKDDRLITGGQQGLSVLRNAAQARDRLCDANNRPVIDRILTLPSDLQQGLWHKSCYSIFTSKSHIDRLEKKWHATASRDTQPSTSGAKLRSATEAMNWNLCLFCQNSTGKQTLSSVTTFKMSDQILSLSKYDQDTYVRLAGVNDLIAAEGKYHPNCLKRFQRNASKTKQSSEKTDLAMEWLTNEINKSASSGHVLELSEVWNRYCELAQKADIDVPASYVSRRSTFKEKVEACAKDVYDFVTIPKRDVLLIPRKYVHASVENLLSEDPKESCKIPVYQPHNDWFLEMVHIALKLRSDILAHPQYRGFVVDENEMIGSVPDSLFMFIRLMFGGQTLLEGSPTSEEEVSADEKEAETQRRVLSLAQDIVYNVTGGKHWTPKHVGLASTLHQATRSKELIHLFHNAGHMISYHSLLQVDTALAEKTMKTMDPETGAVTPPNFVPGRFTHFTCDNIDINDSSLDGKNTFHATQMAAWQRGPEGDLMMTEIEPSRTESLHVPAVMETLFPAQVIQGRTEPKSTENTQKEWFVMSKDSQVVAKATAQDMAFFIKRQDEGQTKEGWTSFNQRETDSSPQVTSISYMPIVQAPAHDFDTLNTVVLRCKHVAQKLGQQHVVITVDEALFCKLMELKWAKPDFQDCLIVRLGGLHIAMNFMKVLGKHVQSSGLLEAWIDGNLIGSKTAVQIMDGKSYAKGMRLHKITLQAMWRLLLPQLLTFMKDTNPDLKKEICETKNNATEKLEVLLASEEFGAVVESFVTASTNPNFRYWWGYMKMVHVLLMFTRAQRDGIWDLHLCSFQAMLPYFMRYNHINYARWGTVYLNEMHQLPQDVKREFEAGNFVVKRSPHSFNQVDPDQSQEWLNCVGKKGGGIIGITKTSSALGRWALSYNLRSHLALETREVFGLGSGDNFVHNETTKSRQKRDSVDEDALLLVLSRFGLFSSDMPQTLQNIANKDLVSKDIEEDLLAVERKGQEQLNTFVAERLLPAEERRVHFRDSLQKNKCLTFASLFEVRRSDSKTEKEKN